MIIDKDGNKISGEEHFDDVAEDIFDWLKSTTIKNQ